jgi:hypothetical protein
MLPQFHPSSPDLPAQRMLLDGLEEQMPGGTRFGEFGYFTMGYFVLPTLTIKLRSKSLRSGAENSFDTSYISLLIASVSSSS